VRFSNDSSSPKAGVDDRRFAAVAQQKDVRRIRLREPREFDVQARDVRCDLGRQVSPSGCCAAASSAPREIVREPVLAVEPFAISTKLKPSSPRGCHRVTRRSVVSNAWWHAPAAPHGKRRNAMMKGQMPAVSQGARIYTADGASIGKVAEVGDVSFKVDARMARDYWLGRDYVTDSSADRVSLSFPKSDLKAHKLGTGATPAEKDPSLETHKDTVIPEDEQMEQRRRMEAELDRQKRDMIDDGDRF
jgi:hypothetical protein